MIRRLRSKYREMCNDVSTSRIKKVNDKVIVKKVSQLIISIFCFLALFAARIVFLNLKSKIYWAMARLRP